MTTPLKLSVPDMSCGHCKASVTAALTALDAAAQPVIDLERREVSLTTEVAPQAVLAALEDIGFDAQLIS